MEDLIRQLLSELGEDPDREGLLRTPLRVAKALKFLTSGYDADIDEVLNGALFTVDYSEMVIVRDIDYYSLCEHHLLPFFGKCHVAYIPNGRVIGLSKIPRLVNVFARRGGRLRGHPSLHVDARRREAELDRGDERHARVVSNVRANAHGVPRAP